MALPPKGKWGPVLWKILHTAADCLGNQTHPILKQDERQGWINVLNSLEGAMPCIQCQKHYREWRFKHPLEVFRFADGEALREAARNWLLDLHNNVNSQNKGEILPAEKLDELYSDRTPAFFKKQMLDLQTILGNTGESYRKFQRCLILLLKIVNKY